MDNIENDKKSKSRKIAGLLGIFLGVFGAHNFYLGYVKKAIIQLCLILCCPLFFFFAVYLGAGAHPDYVIIAGLLCIVGVFFAVACLIVWLTELVKILAGNSKDSHGNSLR